MAAAHAQLVELLRNREALHVFLNQESSDAACAHLGFGFGVDHQGVGVRPIGDPHFVAVQNVITTFVFGFELHADDVRACTRLAHGQCTDVFTGDELGQVFLLLRFSAVAFDLIDTQVAVRTIRQAHAGRCTRNFFHGNHVRQVTHVGATIGFGHRNAQHAHFAHLAPQVHRKLIGAVNFCRTRGNLCLGKIADSIAQCIDVFAQLKVQAWHVHVHISKFNQ